jgi:DNA polymerase-3 subunit epsilon
VAATHGGVTLGRSDTLLTDRARDFLAAGPADSCTLIAHVCQLPAVPGTVADHMAVALFAQHRGFRRGDDGRWHLVAEGTSTSMGIATPLAAPAITTEASSAGAAFAPPARMDALESLPYAVVDVETTGSSPLGDRITEVAAVVVENGEVRTVFETLVNPRRPIPPYISALTHITWDMVKDAPTFAEICDQLLGVLEGRIFVAHNASFDWRFVNAEVERAIGRQLEGRRLCTVRLARKVLPHLRRRSLDSVTNHYAIEIAARHRAGGDALATAHVLLRLLRDVRGRGCETWNDLETLLGGGRRLRGKRRPPAMPHPVSEDTTA